MRHVDLGGRTLIPGFNDAHVHVSWLGMLLTSLVDTRIHVAPNIPSIEVTIDSVGIALRSSRMELA